MTPQRVSVASGAARWPESVHQDQPEAMRRTHAAFTWPERALLLNVNPVPHDFLSWPASAADRYDDGTRSGGGKGFSFRCTTTAVVGTWQEFTPVAWYADGEPKQWEHGAQLGEAKVTYRRLQRWGESMPAAIREWALTWARLWPENTSDPIALSALVISLLCDPAPVETPEPTDLLELLEMTNA